jgi:hypothetical protein
MAEKAAKARLAVSGDGLYRKISKSQKKDS